MCPHVVSSCCARMLCSHVPSCCVLMLCPNVVSSCWHSVPTWWQVVPAHCACKVWHKSHPIVSNKRSGIQTGYMLGLTWTILFNYRGARAGPAGTAAAGPMWEAKLMNLIKGRLQKFWLRSNFSVKLTRSRAPAASPDQSWYASDATELSVLFQGIELWLKYCLLHNVTENITKKTLQHAQLRTLPKKSAETRKKNLKNEEM